MNILCCCCSINLERFPVAEILHQKPITINLHDNVARLAQLLLSNSHGGFPVVTTTEQGEEVFFGFINRFKPWN